MAAHLLATLRTAHISQNSQDTTVHWYSEASGYGTFQMWGDATTLNIELRSVPTSLATSIAAAITHAACGGTQ